MPLYLIVLSQVVSRVVVSSTGRICLCVSRCDGAAAAVVGRRRVRLAAAPAAGGRGRRRGRLRPRAGGLFPRGGRPGELGRAADAPLEPGRPAGGGRDAPARLRL